MKPPIVSNDLSRIPRVIPSNGLRLFDLSFRPAKFDSVDNSDSFDGNLTKKTPVNPPKP